MLLPSLSLSRGIGVRMLAMVTRLGQEFAGAPESVERRLRPFTEGEFARCLHSTYLTSCGDVVMGEQSGAQVQTWGMPPSRVHDMDLTGNGHPCLAGLPCQSSHSKSLPAWIFFAIFAMLSSVKSAALPRGFTAEVQRGGQIKVRPERAAAWFQLELRSTPYGVRQSVKAPIRDHL